MVSARRSTRQRSHPLLVSANCLPTPPSSCFSPDMSCHDSFVSFFLSSSRYAWSSLHVLRSASRRARGLTCCHTLLHGVRDSHEYSPQARVAAATLPTRSRTKSALQRQVSPPEPHADAQNNYLVGDGSPCDAECDGESAPATTSPPPPTAAAPMRLRPMAVEATQAESPTPRRLAW